MPFKQLAFPRFDLRRSITSNTFVVKGQQLFLEISNLAIKRYQAYHCRPVPNEDIPFTSLFSIDLFLPPSRIIQHHSSIHPLLWRSGDLRSCRRLRHHQQLVERHGCQRGTVGAVVELLLLLLLLLVLVLLLLLLLSSSSCHRVQVRDATSREGRCRIGRLP